MITSGSLFKVHSPFLALKSLSNRQVYVMLPVGAVGEVVETYDDLERPGLVMLKVDGETLFIWTRDLQLCSEAVWTPLRVLNVHTL